MTQVGPDQRQRSPSRKAGFACILRRAGEKGREGGNQGIKREREKKKGGTKRQSESVCVYVCVCVCLKRDWRFARGGLHQYRSFSGQDTWDGSERVPRKPARRLAQQPSAQARAGDGGVI